MSDIDRLIADFERAGVRVAIEARAVVSKAAHNVMEDWRKEASGLRHAPLYPRSITYDVFQEGPVIVAEIGPDKELPQGPLGNLIEYGSPTSNPHNFGGQAMDREEPRFIAYMEALGATVGF